MPAGRSARRAPRRRLALWCGFVVASLVSAVAAAAGGVAAAGVGVEVSSSGLRRRLRASLASSDKGDVYPDCSCLCCVVQRSVLKSAITGEQERKCFPPPANTGQQCQSVCNTKDSILSNAQLNAAGQRLVSYNRYCFAECKPPSCDAPTDQMVRCMPLSPEEVAQAMTPGGNGQEISAGCY
eukprot:CAMPEP_0170246694 /NCGR_PEP_ID=MMETSP0116_2-20130129/23135_1 /TAXON_ID=400756 /ORGANISM="Durinskia baltica, Strain CSIRO CS-38" /LENGTH=181 /DNA_ID=CAMNT_0010497573 /DNA_START=15 /DNA_END=560 /DNA_ORIENTATION=+